MHWLDQRIAEISQSASDPIVKEATQKLGEVGKALIDYLFDQAKGTTVRTETTVESHQVLDAKPVEQT